MMTAQQKPPHLVLLPFMAQGHMIPMVDISRILAKRGLTVTILITPINHERIKPMIDRAITSGLTIRVSLFRFPCAETGLPEGFENLEGKLSIDDSLKFIKATAILEDQIERALQSLEPRPACLISDMCFAWSTAVAARLGIPRIVFHGTSCFALVCMHLLRASKGFDDIAASDTEYFVLPDLPDRIEVTKAQIRGTNVEVPEWAELREKMLDAESKALGTVANTFDELEPEYVRRYAQVIGKRVWCIGPVSSCNEDDLDKAQRGNRSSIEPHECLRWLDSREQGSVIFVCLGSLSCLAASQLVELGLGLEASGRPFVWVIRNASDEFKMWLNEEKFVDRVEERGLVIHGWAPQVLILSHPSVGGFLTHCGWNSTLEGVEAGVPMLTWPVLADQFMNERFIVKVARTGVRVGVEVPVMFGHEEKVGVQVRCDGIKGAIEELMEGGERRERARELGRKAKRATEEGGGSSYRNLTRLINDVVEWGNDCGNPPIQT